MSVPVEIDVSYEFSVRASFADVFDVLSDVPLSASHFPKLERLVDMGGGVYRWEMERVGTEQVHVQTVYASRYVSNRRQGKVSWTPREDIGNARIAGAWTVRRGKGFTALTLDIKGTVDVDLPALMRMIVEPVVREQFEQLVEQYIDNLIERFGGEVQA